MKAYLNRFGTIISTKAILDKNTNKCKGYGFVDFESPQAAEAAVKALQLQGIQAQMAKVIVKVKQTLYYHLYLFKLKDRKESGIFLFFKMGNCFKAIGNSRKVNRNH